MPHDTDSMDMWYHDTMSEFCFMVLTPQLVIHMLERPEKYSIQDCIDELNTVQKHFAKGKAMMYEHYLEMKRLKLVK